MSSNTLAPALSPAMAQAGKTLPDALGHITAVQGNTSSDTLEHAITKPTTVCQDDRVSNIDKIEHNRQDRNVVDNYRHNEDKEDSEEETDDESKESLRNSYQRTHCKPRTKADRETRKGIKAGPPTR